jgi:hypothetical protein
MLPAGGAFAHCHQAFFDPTTYEVSESAGSVALTVSDPGPVPGDRTVDYASVDGTAKAGTDFDATSGTLSFSSTSTSRTITVPIRNDRALEGNESFTVELSTRDGSCIQDLSRGSTATVTIKDDEAPAKGGGSKTGGGSSTTPTSAPGSRSPSPSATPPQGSRSLAPVSTIAESPYAEPNYGDEPNARPVGAIVGIVLGSVVLGGVSGFWIRGRFLT